jgi:putative phosphoesterase
MKIAVLSDIHGNMVALEAIIDEIKKFKMDQIIVLGDIITDIPQYSNETINIVMEYGNYVIQGNREYIINNKLENYSYDQFLSSKLSISQLSEENLTYINNLPESISIKYDKNFSIKCVHGTPFSIYEHLIENDIKIINKCLKILNDKILLCGHTHCQWYKNINDKIILNPGSVGLNFNGTKLAQYAIIHYQNEKVTIELKQIEYD